MCRGVDVWRLRVRGVGEMGFFRICFDSLHFDPLHISSGQPALLRNYVLGVKFEPSNGYHSSTHAWILFLASTASVTAKGDRRILEFTRICNLSFHNNFKTRLKNSEPFQKNLKYVSY